MALTTDDIAALERLLAPEILNTKANREIHIQRAFGDFKDFKRKLLMRISLDDKNDKFTFMLLTLLNDSEKGFNEVGEDTLKQKSLVVFLKAISSNEPKKSRVYIETHKYIDIIEGNRRILGLRPYTIDDAEYFFGREHDVENLVKKIEDDKQRLIIIDGPSGCGKSSLVGAGVLPKLSSEKWRILVIKPSENDGNPFLSLLRKVTDKTTKDIHKSHKSLIDKLDGFRSNRNLLIYIDQWEELFTDVRIKSEEIFLSFQKFLIKLIAEGFTIIGTIRSEYFYLIGIDDRKVSKQVAQNRYTIAIPDEDMLEKMILEPVKKSSLDFEAGLSGKIIRSALRTPNPLPLISYTIFLLYQKLMAQNLKDKTNSNVLKKKHYQELGSVEKSIGQYAQQLYRKLSPKAQSSLGEVFSELIIFTNLPGKENQPMRKPAPLDIVTRTPSAKTLVDELVNARLLVTSVSKQSSSDVKENVIKEDFIVEVAHEALFDYWSTLKHWLDAYAEDLKLKTKWVDAFALWQKKGKTVHYRWSDERLAAVKAMLLRMPWLQLTPDEIEFNRFEWEYLRDELKDPAKSHNERLKIGLQLWAIEDKRSGVGVFKVEINDWYPDIELPDILWCPFPPASTDPQFFIARYPVTVAQYTAYRDFKGMQVPKGNHFDNYPVVNITWQEVKDFCEWVSKESDVFPAGCDPTEWQIRLPTAEEWQQAMNGGDADRKYPWIGDWDANKCNTKESGLEQVIAVGMYPQGASPCGAMDMWGNVWEWTATLAVGMENYVALACGYSSRHSYHEPTSSYPNSKSLDKSKFPENFPIGFRLACCKI